MPPCYPANSEQVRSGSESGDEPGTKLEQAAPYGLSSYPVEGVCTKREWSLIDVLYSGCIKDIAWLCLLCPVFLPRTKRRHLLSAWLPRYPPACALSRELPLLDFLAHVSDFYKQMSQALCLCEAEKMMKVSFTLSASRGGSTSRPRPHRAADRTPESWANDDSVSG